MCVCVQMCVLGGCKRDPWEGCLGVRMCGGSVCVDMCADVWVSMYDRVLGYLGMECTESWGRYSASEVWVELGVFGCVCGPVRVAFAKPPGGF